MRIAEAQSEATVEQRLMQNEIAARQGIVICGHPIIAVDA